MPTLTEQRLWIERDCAGGCGLRVTVLAKTPTPLCGSPICYAKLHAPRPTVCKGCGKVYGRPASLVSEFCSAKCAEEA